MRKYLSVEVEHSRYARFLTLDQAGKNTISLTTLADFQKRAEVKVFLVNQDQRTLLHEFVVDHLPQRHAGEPRIVLKASFDGKNKLQMNISVDGRHYSSTAISMKKYLRRKAVWSWLLPAALLILAVVALFFLRTCSTTEKSRISGTSKTELSDRAAVQSAEPAQATDKAEQYADRTDDQDTAETPAASSEPTGTPSSPGDLTTSTGGAEQDADKIEPQPVLPPELSQRIYFGPNSSQLTETAQQKLSEFMQEVQKYEEVQLIIEGHCALYGTEQGREELSRERARRTAEYIQDLGWSPERTPIIRGLAGREPVSRDSEKQNLNRRVEITVVPPDSNISSRQDQ